jgi:predicted CXXCH cytochrome family protein
VVAVLLLIDGFVKQGTRDYFMGTTGRSPLRTGKNWQRAKWIGLLILLAGTLGSGRGNPLLREWPVERCRNQELKGVSAQEDSLRCLACHDGVLAPDITPLPTDTGEYTGHRNHPVLVSYLAAYQRDPGLYVPPSQLDPRIHLEDGQVQCSSCHAPASREPARLVMPNHGDALCQSCHRM